VDLTTSVYGAAFKPGLRRGFLYSDCWVDDARLVVLNARDAADRGARILTRTKFTSATPADAGWRVCLEDSRDKARTEIHAKALVNAAGPWLANTLNAVPGAVHQHRVRLVKGSHIVVPRQYPGDHALILQNDDERVVFVIPFEGDFSLIGTTDVAVGTEPGSMTISDDEVDYLCRAVNRYLASAVTADQVVWSYSGVRPLFDDGAAKASEISRDYALELDRGERRPPLLTVYGGKLTTYRRLAQRALDMLSPMFPGMTPAWTADCALPGGALGKGGIDGLRRELHDRFRPIDEAVIKHLVHRHGSLTAEVLAGSAQGSAGLRHFGADLFAFEVDYLMRREWAQCADDVLWRRTKSGLRLDAAAADAVRAYMQQVAVVAG
jgi:glycerol-3-phosphate dehydrogenase